MNGRLGLLGTRRALAASATVIVLAAGAIASDLLFAGSGGGATTTLTAAGGGITIATTTVGPLTPQINPADTTPVTVTVDNTASHTTYVAQIAGAIQTNGACEGSWFSVAPIAPGAIAPGEHTYASSVILNDNDRNQAACTSHTQTIVWKTASVPPARTSPAKSTPGVGFLGPGP
jgi:hypothetical protein